MPATTMTTPPEVEVVRSFVNTVDPEKGSDDLTGPADLARWLLQAGLLAKPVPASGRDLRLALRLRDALRAELEANHAKTPAPEGPTPLERVCEELPLKAISGPAALAPTSGGVRGALGQIVAAATTARIKGSWARLKICPADDCAWAFFDTSRNRSRRWCSMEVCGNREKVRAYRDRTRP